MASAQVRIFPHSRDRFSSERDLCKYLLTRLRERDGVYNLRNANAVADVPPGSVVLFRYGDDIVGEAVVSKGKELIPETERAGWEAKVTFVPSSLRLYEPPLPVQRLQPHLGKDVVNYAAAYTILDWSEYGIVLQEVVTKGTFITRFAGSDE